MKIVELLNQGSFDIKMCAGKQIVPVHCDVVKGEIQLNFPFCRELLDAIKTRFENRKWLGPPMNPDGPKIWSIPITHRNLFQFEALHYPRLDPYKRWSIHTDYTQAIKDYWEQRYKPKGVAIYGHQIEMINWMLNTGWFICAGEMGVGKTLAAILTMELSGITDWFWVGPKTPLVAVKYEFIKWRSPLKPDFYTYDGLKDVVKHWPAGKPAPKGMVDDESSRLKTPASQRSVATKHLADSMRTDHGEKCFILELSGTPAPKNPLDWWHQCEIAAPGFVKEGNIQLFKDRLGVFVDREQVSGAGKYKHLVTWKDSDDKCNACGLIKNHANHFEASQEVLTLAIGQTHERHPFVAMKNEVADLHRRLKGLVGVWLLKDCTDLPDKRYETIHVKPSRSVLNAAKLITDTSRSAIDALIRLRCLSDGFQYTEVQTGEETCPLCKGKGETLEWFDEQGILSLEEVESKTRIISDEDENGVSYIKRRDPIVPIQRTIVCPTCQGDKLVPIIDRQVTQVECPKDDVVLQMLDRSDEYGRLNIYAGFTGSIDRICGVVRKEGWGTLRVDGRGWEGRTYDNKIISKNSDELLKIYQEGQNDHNRLVFVGQGDAAGMGLTLTAARITFFFSNTFNAESRIQAEARGYRLGMDVVKGGWIIDCVHLPSDQKVLDNLKLKRDLQYLSMTGLKEQINAAVTGSDRE